MKLIHQAGRCISFGFLFSSISCGLYATNSAPNAPHTQALALQRFDDGQIVAILAAVDQSEIADAEVALARPVSPSVVAFAEYLKKHHSENLVQLSQLQKKLELKPSSSQQLIAMQQQGGEELKQLSAADTKDFDALYVDDMVKGHTGGLALIDTKLLKQVTNPQLMAFLVEFRAMVKHHLDSALALQKK